ncbi:acyl-CoA dehydrogenase family protein [Terrisporobacter hibernicus]|uniref:Acyl-CoA dehydrogenase family protein n=1 Tax=Terrisporobacter hibernicus TaxID=2813371 RepID=A0AAX2ZIP7_9FIRM|nr:acyl-CoA dehydrogenase family protein [Terrisporobacter hibernicus]UEL49223.1 acyl-CoA dehydrogenase family protein [Terrisporobacter hibernicus]
MEGFKLTKEQLLQKELFYRFSENEIRPIARDMDEAEEYSQELIKKLQKAGMFGIPYSREYGGQGSDVLTYALCMEEVSKIDASTGITISVHTSLACACINEFGSEEQKQKHLRPLVDGSKIGCFGLTEPNAGTDASGVQTEAVLDGDEYVLSGSKIFTTNSGFADTFVIFALTDKSKGPKGMSAFIVDRNSKGLSIGKNIPRMGIRAASNCEVAIENVRVPKENLLGKEGQGYKIAMTALGGGRIGIGAQAVGIAQGCINETVKYVKERKQFNQRISQFQNTQFKLAELQTKVDAARLMVWRAAVAKDNKENYAPLAAMCKLYASGVANDVARDCVQLFGGYGYSREYPVERALRDAKITEIYEGTSEAMKMIISGSMKIK